MASAPTSVSAVALPWMPSAGKSRKPDASDPQTARHELSPDRVKDLNRLIEGEIEVLAT